MSFFSCTLRIKWVQTCCRSASPSADPHCLEKVHRNSSSHRALFMPPFPFAPGFVHLFMRQPCISSLSYLAGTLSPNEKHFLTYISLDTINNSAFTETNVLNLWLAVTVLLKSSIVCLTELISMCCSEKKITCSFLLNGNLDGFYFVL